MLFYAFPMNQKIFDLFVEFFKKKLKKDYEIIKFT